MYTSPFKLTKSIMGNYRLNLREACGTKAIAKIATEEELKEAREWVEDLFEEPLKSELLKDLGEPEEVLKYKNGSVVYAEAYMQRYWYLNTFNEVESGCFEGDAYDLMNLTNKNVFFTKKEANEYAKKIKIYNALERQITIINAENNWVEDWSDGNQWKYYLDYHTTKNEYSFNWCNYSRTGGQYMSVQALDWLLSDEVSDKERKVWIEGL